MDNLINARFILGISPGQEMICAALGLPAAQIDDPVLITSDVVVIVASAKTGIDPKVVAQWSTFRELYIPTIVAIIDFADGDVDFEDMSAIVGKMLEPVLTPYLVLHANDGAPTAVINLEDQSANAVSFRYRNGEQKNQIPIKQAIDEVLAAIKDRAQI